MHDIDPQPSHHIQPRTIAGVAQALAIIVAAVIAVGITPVQRAGAHDDGTTSHLFLAHIKPMKVVGRINDRGNPVDWTKLKDVPDEIADGQDDGVETAGSGLHKSGDQFSVVTTKVQERLSASCPASQTIRSIAQSGAPVCNTGPRGFTKTIADAGPLCNTDCTLGTLVLEPGTFFITAKVVIRQGDLSEDELVTDCHLDAGGKTFGGGSVLETWGSETLRFQLLATLTDNVHATLNCGDADRGDVRAHDLSIIAIRVSE